MGGAQAIPIVRCSSEDVGFREELNPTYELLAGSSRKKRREVGAEPAPDVAPEIDPVGRGERAAALAGVLAGQVGEDRVRRVRCRERSATDELFGTNAPDQVL